ncbi:MAG TPA: hypothetical protein VMW22_09470, partial [Candidatus Desulfaltia sp.]|nr:hypothetical protein [Candidatus Desulfaltia sp.]
MTSESDGLKVPGTAPETDFTCSDREQGFLTGCAFLNITDTALLIGFALSFLMAIALGGNDAASPTANVVGARVL